LQANIASLHAKKKQAYAGGMTMLAYAMLVLVSCSASGAQSFTGKVIGVADGDTMQLDDGRRVRLLQLDAPEGGEDEECYAEEAREMLSSLVEKGGEILLVADPLLDQEDRFGRLLRYVYVDGNNVNVELVRRGAATVWFFEDEEGIFATELLEAATVANETGLGLWSACPDTAFDPRRGADTGPA